MRQIYLHDEAVEDLLPFETETRPGGGTVTACIGTYDVPKRMFVGRRGRLWLFEFDYYGQCHLGEPKLWWVEDVAVWRVRHGRIVGVLGLGPPGDEDALLRYAESLRPLDAKESGNMARRFNVVLVARLMAVFYRGRWAGEGGETG